ncbi:MAG: T9SS type A sorting domain-containing protein [Bacteroidota bacterium]
MPRFCLLLLILLPFASFSQYPSIHESRPRIWADSSRFAWIHNNMGSGECGSTYTDFRYRYDNYWITDPQLYLVGNDSTLWTWDWSSQYAANQAVFTAFLQRITNEAVMLKRCVFIANRFIHTIDTIHFQTMEWYTKETFLRGLSDAGGTILDWVYNALPADKRQRLAQSLFKLDKEFMATYILSSAGTSYVSSHNAYNSVQTMQNAIVLHNADGLTQAKNDSVIVWFHSLYDKWNNGFFPCYGYYRNTNGGWNWGAAYAMWSLTDQFKLFDNMFYGTTKNYYTDLPWVLNSINQYWYFIQPDLNCIHLGDGVTNLWADNVVYRHAAIYQDPRSLWLSQTYSQPQYLTWTYPVFIKLLFKDFSLPPVSKPDLPHFWLSDKVGLAVARTSWDSAGTMVWFFNSWSKKASHEHRDNNSFAVYKNGPLLIDAGHYDSYGSSHYMNYYSRTIAHNNVCVFDTMDVYNYGTTSPVSNDGGQVWSDPLVNFNSISDPHYQRGKWLLYACGENFQYSVADAALSYDSLKLSHFIRRFLYYKSDKILILDHILVKNPSHRTRKVQWLLHSKNQPHVSGTMVSSPVPGHLEVFNGTDYSISNGDGNASVRTLIPSGTLTRRIGGNGWEYWVNGLNYPPSVPPDTLHSTPGKWRIEVTPQSMKDTMILLHSIKLGDNASPSVAGGISKQNQYTVGADWDDNLFFFNSKGMLNTNYHRMDAVYGGRNVDVFAADLLPSKPYYILVDSITALAWETDTSGILRCSLTLGIGNHRIEISENIVGLKEAPGGMQELFTFFPNPARVEITLLPLNALKGSVQVSIADSRGRVLRALELKKKTLVSLKGMEPGIYFIRAKRSNQIQIEKVVLK